MTLTAGRISALILVQLERHTPEGFQQLRRELAKRADVQWCAEISGAFDLALIATTRSIEELNELIDTVFSQNPAVRRAESSLAEAALESHLGCAARRGAGRRAGAIAAVKARRGAPARKASGLQPQSW